MAGTNSAAGKLPQLNCPLWPLFLLVGVTVLAFVIFVSAFAIDQWNASQWRSAQNPDLLRLAREQLDAALDYTSSAKHNPQDVQLETIRGDLVNGYALLQLVDGRTGYVYDDALYAVNPIIYDCDRKWLHTPSVGGFSQYPTEQFFLENVERVVLPGDEEYLSLLKSCSTWTVENVIGVRDFRPEVPESFVVRNENLGIEYRAVAKSSPTLMGDCDAILSLSPPSTTDKAGVISFELLVLSGKTITIDIHSVHATLRCVRGKLMQQQ